jgi:hypothetical protein
MPRPTATISRQEFAADWGDGMSLRLLAVRYTISRDQVDRLRHIWCLSPRKCGENQRWRKSSNDAKTPAEDEASGSSCDIAPEVAAEVARLLAAGVIRGKQASEPKTKDRVFSVRVFGDSPENWP